jgi:NAD(P)-dependent dehydrogenase (short-subunit alcohol dehydrogenase family)
MAKRWWVLGLGAVAGSSFLIYKAITRRPLVDLHDRVVAITGAASGIGLATAHICAAHGARLVLLDEDAGELAEAAAALAIYDTDVLPLPVSFTDAAAVEAAVEAIYARFDRLDVLVNAAIRLLGGLLPDQDPARLQTALERDLYSAVRLTQLIVPRMVARGRGHIVTASDLSGRIPIPAMAAYSGLAAGLVGFTSALRREVDDAGIRVSLVMTDLVDMPEQAAQSIVDAIQYGHREVVTGGVRIVLGISLERLLSPVVDLIWYWRFMPDFIERVRQF